MVASFVLHVGSVYPWTGARYTTCVVVDPGDIVVSISPGCSVSLYPTDATPPGSTTQTGTPRPNSNRTHSPREKERPPPSLPLVVVGGGTQSGANLEGRRGGEKDRNQPQPHPRGRREGGRSGGRFCWPSALKSWYGGSKAWSAFLDER